MARSPLHGNVCVRIAFWHFAATAATRCVSIDIRIQSKLVERLDLCLSSPWRRCGLRHGRVVTAIAARVFGELAGRQERT